MQDPAKETRKMNEEALKSAVMMAQQSVSMRYARDALKNLEEAFNDNREQILSVFGNQKRFIATYTMSVFLCAIFKVVEWELNVDPTERELFLFEVVESIQKTSDLLLKQQLEFGEGN